MDEIEMKINEIKIEMKNQKEILLSLTKKSQQMIESLTSTIIDSFPEYKIPSIREVKNDLEMYKISCEQMKNEIQKEKEMKKKQGKYLTKDIVTMKFIDCQYRIPRVYAEQLIENCEEINTIECSGKYFNYITAYFRDEAIDINEEEKEEIIKLFTYFKIDITHVKMFKTKANGTTVELVRFGDLKCDVDENQIVIEKISNDDVDESIIIAENINSFDIKIDSIGQFMMGYCFIIGVCSQKENTHKDCVYMPLEGSQIYSNQNGWDEMINGFEAMDGDIISITIDRQQQIIYFSLNGQSPFEVDYQGNIFYPFVKLRIVGSKVTLFNLIKQ